VAAGYSDAEIRELAKDRRGLLDTIATIRGDDPGELGMVGYDYQIPSIEQHLGLTPGEPHSTIGKTIRDSRRLGNNGAQQVGEVAEVTIRDINKLERTLTENMRTILQGKPNQLTGAERLAIVDRVTNWLPNMDNVDAAATKAGNAMADWIMLNYKDRRNIDSILGILTPYHYYWSRMPARALMAAMQKPSLVNFGYEFERAVGIENEQSDVPDRLRGSLPIPGTNYRANVSNLLNYALPHQGYVNAARRVMGDDPYSDASASDNDFEKAANKLEAWAPGLNLIWEMALDAKDGKLDKDYSSVLNSMIPILGMPASSLYQYATGDMPAKDGWAGKVGFGPDVAPDGFPLDVYRARRATTWIAEEEGLNVADVAYANQVILNQWKGLPVEQGIPPEHLQDALALADRGVRRGASDRNMARLSANTTLMSVNPYTEAEQRQRAASAGYNAAGYDVFDNTSGSKDTQKGIIAKTPTLERAWTKSSDNPGLDAQIGALYDEAEITGDYDAVMPQIKALEAQKVDENGQPLPPKPKVNPYVPSTADVLRGPYPGNSPDYDIIDSKGMNPQEQLDKHNKDLASPYWEAYNEIKKGDNETKAAYLRDNPVFAEIYKQNIIDKGGTPEDWWTDYKGTGTKTGTGTGTGGVAPGSVTRDDFTEAELDQYYDEYKAFSNVKDWDGQKAWLAEHPEWARMQADTINAKYGEYPWWYDDVLGGTGAAASAYSGPSYDSQPNSVADVLRKPYDAPVRGKGLGAVGGGDSGGDWSTSWDEYKALGKDNDAKRQYMLDHPEFAAYYVERYGDDSAWWLKGGGGSGWKNYGKGGGGSRYGSSGAFSAEWDAYHAAEDGRQYLIDHPEFAEEYLRFIQEKDPEATAWWLEADWSADWDAYTKLGDNAAKMQYMVDHPEFAEMYKGKYGAWWENGGGGARSYSSYSYGGGGGGGGGGGEIGRYSRLSVDPRRLDYNLMRGQQQQQRPWIPYSNPQPDWLRAGEQLRPDFIRKWMPPKL
jgi:hypothetical protein